jgi:tetratricopeptide (TPR) repeat protein
MRNLRAIAAAAAHVGAMLGVAVFVSGGCAPDADAKASAAGKRSSAAVAAAAAGTSDLNAGYALFAAGQYDRALGVAEQYLAAHPNGARGTAEALYLKGRVYEQRAETAARDANAVGSATALQSARDAYSQALAASPTPGVEVRLLMGLANVAYFQEDYHAALSRWTAALQKLEPLPAKEKADLQDAQAWALYRIGLSQQRLGQFPEADTTFVRVQQTFPNTEPARRSSGHIGARAFQVQVGTFADANNANALMSTLSAEGYASTRSPDANNRQVVRVGPFPTYDLAKAVRKALASKYPGATIVP